MKIVKTAFAKIGNLFEYILYPYFKSLSMSNPVLTKPNVTKAVPFFAVANMENSLHFYIEGIGFTMTEKWIDGGKIRWCWLQLGEAAVMLQEFKREGHDSWKPEGKLGEGVSICFICNDAISIYRDLMSRGINATRPFVGNAMWVTGCSDPDGYRLEFESFTDIPEETILKDI